MEYEILRRKTKQNQKTTQKKQNKNQKAEEKNNSKSLLPPRIVEK